MPDNTAMIPVNLDQLPSTQIGTDDQFAELAKGGDYINRLKLYTKSKDSIKGLIPDGHYGIPESDEKVIDLGVSVDILPPGPPAKGHRHERHGGAGHLLRYGSEGVQADRHQGR